MSDLAQPAEVFVTPDQRAGVFALYHKGLYIQAYNMAEAIGPLRSWRGTEARILAGRLAGNLGSIRMADWHWVHAWRKDRKHPEALWFFTRYLMGARGSMAAWRFVSAQKFPQDASEELRSHWHSQQAAILGSMRDFDAAEDMLKKAEAIRVEPWTCLEWAGLYTMEDRTEDAEAAARRALDMHPWYRPAVQWVAHFLVQKQRDKEALDLLTEATIRLESGAVWGQLAALQIELKRYDEAWRSLAEFERLSPLLYKDDKSWLDARRCDIECRRGNYDKALEYAKLVDIKKNKYHEGLIKRLSERKEPGKRVETPVPFVRQHHKTCAPATLTSIAKFWQMPAEHVEVAEEITYGGTPHHSERKWAIDNGWFTKSFTVTWDAAVALIDNGIPFTLATMEVSSGHLQAVIGYDSACRNLIIRDPGDRHTMEMPFDWMQERYRSTGPRGMALVPIAQQEKLAALQLPDEGLYENVLKYELALVDHKRNEAGEIVKAMEAAAPGHYLTLSAKRALCIYDADQPAGLIVTEQLLKMFPGDLFLELSRADYLRWLGRYEERIEILKKLAEQKETDPACWHFYAQELSADARNDVQTIYYLRKSIRTTPPQAPLHGRLLNTLARLRWNQRKFDEALQLHHFAACQEDQDEYIAMDYFQAARGRGETEQVLQFLQKRFKRFGAKSAQPARTLYNAYVQLERLGEAYDVLEDAMKRRPKDGDLMTYAAEALVYKGEFDRAIDILATAKGISKPGGWLRTSAFVALQRGDPAQAREFWKELLEKEPLADDAHRMYAQLLSEREGREAAVAHLVAACKRFPYHFGLNRLWYEWLLQDGPAAREPIIKKMIHIHPADVGARISYAYNLLDQDRMDDAIRQLDEAESIDPHSSGVWFAKSDVYKRKNQFEDAQFSLRQAVRLWVDYDFAVRELIWSAENLAERRDALAFIEQELLRQRTFGNGVLALRDAAWNLLPPEELLGSLRRVLAVRPDLWHAWSATIHQLVHMERGDEALETAQKAVQRFPLLPGIWLDLADAHRINKNAQYELDSIRRALQLSPAWNIALRMLVDAHERAGTHQEAKHAIEQAISWAPLTAINYLDYAEYYWRHSAPDDAIKQVRQALKIDPWLDQAWNDLCNWTLQLDRYDEAMSLAKEWTKARPGEARSWLRLAQAIQWQGPKTRTDEEDERINECAKAYDEALKRNPFAGDIHDMKAEMLAFAQRYDDARKACNPPAWKGKAPINLRGRAAWIKSQQGEFDDAKAMMCAALKEDMKYQWGWDRLVDWSFATRQFKEYLDAANDMLRMRPQSAIALTYRGEARLRNEEREAGMEDLKNAFRKDPCIILTGSLLFDEQVIDDNLVGAEATLLSMQQNQIGDFVKARQVQFQCKKENQSLAIDKFRDLCAMGPGDARPRRRRLARTGRASPQGRDEDSELQPALRSAVGRALEPKCAERLAGTHRRHRQGA
jgi:tetratricopeptide (TPR) repeat protein